MPTAIRQMTTIGNVGVEWKAGLTLSTPGDRSVGFIIGLLHIAIEHKEIPKGI